ncbi:hypothetical protein [Pararobbsia alpina]|uniref:Uncharacterized protein n=1 Tax=Pararobbsia alpina TaxID=621374 RepID=A0A6S7CF26_9BURK|nr:hypothetical protein LMG28138_05993 [Pararobbsia alpina]
MQPAVTLAVIAKSLEGSRDGRLYSGDSVTSWGTSVITLLLHHLGGPAGHDLALVVDHRALINLQGS